MVKRLVQIIIILVLLFISFCLYLSIYGLNTNKFNDLISKKISEKNKNFTITFDKIKIFLNIGSLNLEIKTDKPIIIFQNKEIKIKSISTSLPIKSIIKKQCHWFIIFCVLVIDFITIEINLVPHQTKYLVL